MPSVWDESSQNVRHKLGKEGHTKSKQDVWSCFFCPFLGELFMAGRVESTCSSLHVSEGSNWILGVVSTYSPSEPLSWPRGFRMSKNEVMRFTSRHE